MAYQYPLNGGRINATIGGNTAGAGSLVSSGTLTLVGGNNVTLSQAGNAITISGGAGGAGVALANSQTTYTSGTANLGVAGGAMTIASTTGQSFNFSVPATSLISATGAVSISTNGATISIGAPAFDAGVSNLGNTSGTTGSNTNGLFLVGGNNITLNQSTNATGAYVTISGGAGVGLANSQTTYSNGVANLNVAGGAMTIASTTGQSFNFSVPQVSNILATGALSMSVNGGTISLGLPSYGAGISNLGNTSGTSGSNTNKLVLVGGNNITLSQSTNATGAYVTISGGAGGGGGPATLSRWEHPTQAFGPLNTVPQGSLSIQHVYVPFPVTGTAMKLGGSLSVATNTGATTASVNSSLWMGIYTLTGSTLSRMSSGSTNNGYSLGMSASTTGISSITGMRQLTVPMSINMTPGEYWVAAVISSASTYTASSNGFTLYGNSVLPTPAGLGALTPIGGNTTANRDVFLFQGIYTAVTSAGPITMSGGHINNTSASNIQRAAFYHAIFNATY